MKLTVDRNKLSETPESFLHHSGWGLIHDRRRGVSSFVKRLGSGFYPRLHLYVDERDNFVIFNMHMDQKEASYEGNHMHNAEYDNELVIAEIENIKRSLGVGSDQPRSSNPVQRESQSTISIPEPPRQSSSLAADLAALKAEKPKSFWQRVLGI
ncbi:MAG: hypothetical protein WC564_04665 [Patescibacteria group bacterium]